MRKGTSLNSYLENFNSIECFRYNSPAGKIYLFADNSSLKASVYEESLFNKSAYNSLLTDVKNTSIKAAVKYLDFYFEGNGNNIPVKIYLEKKVKQVKTGDDRDLLILDISVFTDNEKNVYSSLVKVKPGITISYGKLAEKAGIPGGARFIGNTMAKNMFPVIIPCHRVVKSDGKMGYYSGGVGIKQLLLEHETA